MHLVPGDHLALIEHLHGKELALVLVPDQVDLTDITSAQHFQFLKIFAAHLRTLPALLLLGLIIPGPLSPARLAVAFPLASFAQLLLLGLLLPLALLLVPVSIALSLSISLAPFLLVLLLALFIFVAILLLGSPC